MKSTIFALALSTLLAFSPAMAEDHAPGQIIGTGIELFERNHSFAGEINGTPVFGVFDEANFVSEVTIRHNGSTLLLKIADSNGKFVGSLTEDRTDEATGKSTQIVTSLEFAGVKKTGEVEGLVNLIIDGQAVVVNIVGESFANNHFHAPTYSTTLNGQSVTFSFNGEACFGYSTNLSMMILGAMAHIAK